MALTTRQKDRLNTDFHPTAQETSLGDATFAAPVIFEWISSAAFNTAAVTAFTAPFAMRLVDIIVEGRNSQAAVVTVRKAATAVCTEITAAELAVIHMTAGAVAAELVLAAGDIVTVQSNHANSRAAITFIGVRL